MSENGPSANIKPIYGWVIVISVFFMSGLIINSQIQSGNFLSFLVVGGIIAMPFWIILTDSGATWLMNATSASSDSSSIHTTINNNVAQDKIVCSFCGWQNLTTNNYCMDCGEKIESD
ncbi:hypothetical protein [Haloarcula laminariae]|uniref:hypothetical protein n=1 Tax=Haloarcula laminariae TaxID=2961577 RepID=UPI002406B304|nr:hypothetical protein [Halomicroarcula sp. FL173]